MPASFYINLELGIVVEKLSGTIDKQTFLELLGALYNDTNYNKTNKILTDLRGSIAILEATDIEEIASFIKSNSKNSNFIKNAILVDKPLETAYSLFYHSLMHDMPNYECVVCITEEKAADYLGIDSGKLFLPESNI